MGMQKRPGRPPDARSLDSQLCEPPVRLRDELGNERTSQLLYMNAYRYQVNCRTDSIDRFVAPEFGTLPTNTEVLRRARIGEHNLRAGRRVRSRRK